MIRMIPSTSSGHAKAYFKEALTPSDYYISDQELQGQIKGQLAVRIGVTGPATKEVFFALCENINPILGTSLTPKTRDNRITGYDINFHCPKSVSIIHALSKDEHILEAFERAVTDTMRDIESDSKTRVRKDGAYEDRKTGELVWSEFTHQTARPLEGELPDPHLHSHCFVFNATWDAHEQRIKAGKFRDIKRDMPYYQAAFHKRLADNMVRLGYKIKNMEHSFEIEGVPKQIIDHFSKRSDEIGRIAKAKGITSKKDLDALGARTRGKKQKGLGMHELKKEWLGAIKRINNEISLDENEVIRFSHNAYESKIDPASCIDYMSSHCFERASVIEERQMLGAGYKHALGQTEVSIENINDAFEKDKRLIRIKQGERYLCTTKDVLKEEKRMVELAKLGRNALPSLYEHPPELTLEGQQGAAVLHVLTTSNRVSIVRGAAGSGKTTLMKEAVEKIEAKGKKVTVVAPTAQASRGVLKDEGFKDADTVAQLLANKKMQEQLKDQVLWVDEAGLLGTKDMKQLLEIATKQNARLILGGDTKQHASVVRGDALRILNTVGGIKSAEVSKIYRQKTEHYKAAVEDLSKGNIVDGFEKLDKIGFIKPVDPLNPHEDLVNDYMTAIKEKRSVLVISPTHKQGEKITNEIRLRLRKLGKLGKKEITADKLTNLNLTEAQKGDWRNYQKGQVIQFNQHAKKIKRGSSWVVDTAALNGIHLVNKNGEKQSLPLKQSERFSVFELSQINLSKGDMIRITHNGTDQNQKRLDNGMTLEVVAANKFGKLMLRNKLSKATFHLRKDHGHISHAHCITSYNSQGKTVDEVLIAQPAATFSASDAKQFYVSVSRGKDRARIYTDDKEGLLEKVRQAGDRQSAIELVSKHNETLDRAKEIERQKQQPSYLFTKQKEMILAKIKGKEYEPEF